MTERLDAAWGALRQHPEGATAKQLAVDLDWPHSRASQKLCQLYLYGIIERTHAPRPTLKLGERGWRYEYRYSIKRHAHV